MAGIQTFDTDVIPKADKKGHQHILIKNPKLNREVFKLFFNFLRNPTKNPTIICKPPKWRDFLLYGGWNTLKEIILFPQMFMAGLHICIWRYVTLMRSNQLIVSYTLNARLRNWYCNCFLTYQLYKIIKQTHKNQS